MRRVEPDLPGAELVESGLRDLAAGRATEAALLVSIGAPKLRRLGCAIPAALPDAELTQYNMLAAKVGDRAHGRYNSLVRRLVSFEQAAACVA